LRSFNLVVERDPDTGVGYVPSRPSGHGQVESLEELREHRQEVVSVPLADGQPRLESEFVEVQTIRVA
jgi:hypothetical protein